MAESVLALHDEIASERLKLEAISSDVADYTPQRLLAKIHINLRDIPNSYIRGAAGLQK